MKKRYDCPTMVEFTDGETDKTFMGIAYGKEVICACCGSIFELNEITITKEKEWIPFNNYI